MSVDKSIQYEIQGGVKNYLGKQKEVKAPIKWKSSPDHPETELAYITKAEKDLLVKKDLHGSLKGGVNRGPSGIMSLNGFGSYDSDDPSVDTGMSGAATSAAESGGGSGADARELAAERGRVRSDLGLAQLPPGVVDQDVQDYRDAFIAAGGGQRVNPGFLDSQYTVSPEEIKSAKDYVRNTSQFTSPSLNRGLGGFFTGGGFLGNIIRAIGNRFGLGKKYNEPTYDMSEFSKLGLGGVDPTVNPTFQNDLGNELLEKLAEEKSNDFNRMFDIDTTANLIDKNRGRRLQNLNTFIDPPSKEITDYQNFLTKSPDFVSFDEYQRNKNLASKGIMQNFSEQDLDEIGFTPSGKKVGYVRYDPAESMDIAIGRKIPQLGDLTGFIDPFATMTARERELENLFNK